MSTSSTGDRRARAVASHGELVITRVIDAPRELVFEAYTNPRHLPH